MCESRRSTQGPLETLHIPSPRGIIRRIDQTRNLRLIAGALNQRSAQGEPRLIGIQGVFKSGRTQLASVLVQTGANVSFIDVLHPRDLRPGKSYDISPLLLNHRTTYVIDEAGSANQDSLSRAVRSITRRGCTVVMLFQQFRELDSALVNSMAQFDLLGGLLIERPAHLRAVRNPHANCS